MKLHSVLAAFFLTTKVFAAQSCEQAFSVNQVLLRPAEFNLTSTLIVSTNKEAKPRELKNVNLLREFDRVSRMSAQEMIASQPTLEAILIKEIKVGEELRLHYAMGTLGLRFIIQRISARQFSVSQATHLTSNIVAEPLNADELRQLNSLRKHSKGIEGKLVYTRRALARLWILHEKPAEFERWQYSFPEFRYSTVLPELLMKHLGYDVDLADGKVSTGHNIKFALADSAEKRQQLILTSAMQMVVDAEVGFLSRLNGGPALLPSFRLIDWTANELDTSTLKPDLLNAISQHGVVWIGDRWLGKLFPDRKY